MGTVAVNLIGYLAYGDLRSAIVDVTFSNSYTTGGDTIPLGFLGLKEIVEAYTHSAQLPPEAGRVGGFTPNSHGIQAVLVGTRSVPKLKAFFGSSSEVASLTNLSTVPAVRMLLRGH